MNHKNQKGKEKKPKQSRERCTFPVMCFLFPFLFLWIFVFKISSTSDDVAPSFSLLLVEGVWWNLLPAVWSRMHSACPPRLPSSTHVTCSGVVRLSKNKSLWKVEFLKKFLWEFLKKIKICFIILKKFIFLKNNTRNIIYMRN